MSRGTFGGKTFFSKRLFYEIFFFLDRKKISCLDESIFVNKLNFFDLFRTLRWKILELRQKNRHIWRKCSLRLQKNGSTIGFWKKRFSSYFLTLSAKNYPKLSANFLINLSVIQSECPREQIEGIYFLEKNEIFKNFVLWAKRFRNFDKNSWKVVKIAFYVSRLTFSGTFSKKYHFFSTFSENEQETIQLWAENFRQVFQKFSFEVSR